MSEGDLSDQGLAALPVVTPSSPTAATALTTAAANPNASTPNAKQKLKRRIRRSTTVSQLLLNNLITISSKPLMCPLVLFTELKIVKK